MTLAFLCRLMGAVILLLVGCACSSLSRISTKPVLGQKEWTSYDGKIMPYTTWVDPAGGRPRGIIIAVHGLSGAASDFWFLGDQLARQGYTVYAFEVRGQGKDPNVSNRGDIHSSRQWLSDLESFHLLVRKKHPKTPIFWYGESLGSLICMHTAAERLGDRRDPDGVILASPVAGLRMSVSGFKRALLTTAATVAPRTRFSLGELAGVDESKIQVTSNTTHGGQMAVTDHCISNFTLRLLAEIGRLMDENPRHAKKLHMPVLFLASPNDILSSPDQVQTLFSQVASPNKKLLWYTRSYHLLLHDIQKEEAVKDVTNWLETRVAQMQPRRKQRPQSLLAGNRRKE